MAFVALYDACVLYPAPLRDLLMQLAGTGMFRARWTDRIHDERIRNLAAKRPDLTPAQLTRTRALMNQAVPDCLITGYETIEVRWNFLMQTIAMCLPLRSWVELT
ncbi:MAG TPA: hypothetical protein VMA74_03255 [Dyella sp.]|uniref:hypothetical protein n=1 Tax=Dyella sp. TaxID=1869338 RepID=UPI002C234827|nr:hypothetical protein [Dyella sp.]HUB88725.1 hypothetical protein [Dyella sp.]